MSSLLRGSLIVATVGVVAIVVVVGSWEINQPLPDAQPPPIDEALNRPTYELERWAQQLDEPPISMLSPQASEVYRMTLFPTFSSPIVVCISRSADSFQLRTKLFDGVGGFGAENMGKVTLNQTRDLSPEEFDQLLTLLDRAFFWEIPAVDPTDGPVLDGADWILEGRLERSARSVRRTIPKQALCDVFGYMLRLSDKRADYGGYACDFS